MAGRSEKITINLTAVAVHNVNHHPRRTNNDRRKVGGLGPACLADVADGALEAGLCDEVLEPPDQRQGVRRERKMRADCCLVMGGGSGLYFRSDFGDTFPLWDPFGGGGLRSKNSRVQKKNTFQPGPLQEKGGDHLSATVCVWHPPTLPEHPLRRPGFEASFWTINYLGGRRTFIIPK